MISEGQRLQYLEAMGIQAWISRERASIQGRREPDALDQQAREIPLVASTLPDQLGPQPSTRTATFEIGPGSGSTLLLCSQPEDAATPVASDIARCLDEAPVWGWLATDTGGPRSGESGLSLERAVNERLFTRVLLFCNDSEAEQVGNAEVLNSAQVIYAPPITELARHPSLKRRLWMQLLAHGWCARRA